MLFRINSQLSRAHDVDLLDRQEAVAHDETQRRPDLAQSSCRDESFRSDSNLFASYRSDRGPSWEAHESQKLTVEFT